MDAAGNADSPSNTKSNVGEKEVLNLVASASVQPLVAECRRLTTDPQGRYESRYSPEQFRRAEKGNVDRVVQTYNADELELASSSLLFNAEPDERIDPVVDGEVYRGPSEHKQPVGELIPLLQGLPFTERQEFIRQEIEL